MLCILYTVQRRSLPVQCHFLETFGSISPHVGRSVLSFGARLHEPLKRAFADLIIVFIITPPCCRRSFKRVNSRLVPNQIRGHIA